MLKLLLFMIIILLNFIREQAYIGLKLHNLPIFENLHNLSLFDKLHNLPLFDRKRQIRRLSSGINELVVMEMVVEQ